MEYFKKSIKIAIIIMLAPFTFLGQENETPLQVSFVYPLSINGIKAPQKTNRFSLNLLGDISLNEKYFTLSGITSIIKNDANGFQIAGISNHIGNNAKSFSVAGILNQTNHSHQGLQLAGLANYAKEMKGIQIGGFINMAKKVKGVQISGFMNVAEESDFPIGIFNLIKKGKKSVSVTYDYMDFYNLSLKTGGKYTYGILGVSYNSKIKAPFAKVGLGIDSNISSLFTVKAEGYAQNSLENIEKKQASIYGASIIPSLRITNGLRLEAGIQYDYVTIKDSKYNTLLTKNNNSNKVNQIGYNAGLSYNF